MKTLFILLSLFTLPLALPVQAAESPAAENVTDPAPLRVVEAQYVCMVNDAVFAKAQIPVEVDGRTYYGCCEMCKSRLQEDAAIRTATDPVSGAQVDKATAVIATAPDGTVYYFETEDTLGQFEPAADEATTPAGDME